MPNNEQIAARFLYGKGHDFRDHNESEVATWCATCRREGAELDADCPGKPEN